MRVSFVASTSDPAAATMLDLVEDSQELAAKLDRWGPLIRLDGEVLYSEEPDEVREERPDLVVVLSRHSGTPGRPILTTHVPGNFGDAPFGGEPRRLGVAAPLFMKAFLRRARAEAPPGYEVHMEPTHHGPTWDVPTAFVEVGCSEENWLHRPAAESVLRSVVGALEDLESPESSGLSGATIAAGFGGPHINRRFSKIQLRSGVALGHILRKFDSGSADRSTVIQSIRRVWPRRASLAVVDRKGLPGERRRWILGILEEEGVEVVRADRIPLED